MVKCFVLCCFHRDSLTATELVWISNCALTRTVCLSGCNTCCIVVAWAAVADMCYNKKKQTKTLIILCYFLTSFTGDKRFLHSVKITDLNNLQILCAYQCILHSLHYTPLGDYSLIGNMYETEKCCPLTDHLIPIPVYVEVAWWRHSSFESISSMCSIRLYKFV